MSQRSYPNLFVHCCQDEGTLSQKCLTILGTHQQITVFSADVVSLINFYLILALKLYYIGTYYLDEWCSCIDQIITTMNTWTIVFYVKFMVVFYNIFSKGNNDMFVLASAVYIESGLYIYEQKFWIYKPIFTSTCINNNLNIIINIIYCSISFLY